GGRWYPDETPPAARPRGPPGTRAGETHTTQPALPSASNARSHMREERSCPAGSRGSSTHECDVIRRLGFGARLAQEERDLAPVIAAMQCNLEQDVADARAERLARAVG